MQVEMMLKEKQQQAPQHLNHANAGRDRNHPGFAQTVFTQQVHHVRRQRHRDGHQQHDKDPDQQKGGAAQQTQHIGR